jgi:cholesterol oxidase
VRLHFSEKMAGHCSTEAVRELPYEAAEQKAKAAGSSCEFVVTVATDDCQKLIDDPWHAARIIGTVHMPALSRASMSIADGQFRLFIEDPRSHALKHMSYQMQLQSVEGDSFFLDGFKRLGAGGMTGLWRDTTTLFVDLYRGQDNRGEKAARGVLHITVGSFTKELLNMRASNESGQPSLRGLSLYGMHFASGLWNLYRPRFRS